MLNFALFGDQDNYTSATYRAVKSRFLSGSSQFDELDDITRHLAKASWQNWISSTDDTYLPLWPPFMAQKLG